MADAIGNTKLQNHIANNRRLIMGQLRLNTMAHVLIQRHRAMF